MHYLVYISSMNGSMNEEQLAELLQESRKNNAKNSITGILVYIDGNIIQLLEGEESSVKQVFKRISCDRRHSGIIKITEGNMKDRIFPDWSMCFKSVSAMQCKNLVGYKNLREAHLKSFEGTSDHPALVVLIRS